MPTDGLLYSPHLPADFKALTEKLNVVGTVVIEANALPGDNQWVLDLAKDNPIIVGYIGRLQPGQPEFAAHLVRYAANPIFRGLRLRHEMMGTGSGNAAFEKDILRVAEHRLTLDMVGDAAILGDVARLAKLAPRLRLVIDHLPFREWGQDLAAMRKALEPVAGLPNVFGKISDAPRQVDGKLMTDGKFYLPILDLLRELFGDNRIIYGSNWPVSDFVAPYASGQRILTDYFSSRDKTAAEKFFWKNSLAAYNWVPRGAAAALVGK